MGAAQAPEIVREDDGPLKPLLLDYAAAGRLLGVSARHVRQLVAEGKIRATRLSYKVVRIRPSDLEDYVNTYGTDARAGVAS